jgi:hypothetical protein
MSDAAELATTAAEQEEDDSELPPICQWPPAPILVQDEAKTNETVPTPLIKVDKVWTHVK